MPHALPASCFGAAIPISVCSTLADALHSLLPAELRLSVPSRRASFLAGRLCAGRALAQFGIGWPVLRGDTGEPVWPDGSVGSISHTSEMAYAVAAPASVCAGIGIDSELIVDHAGFAVIQALCCTDRERQQLFDGCDDQWRATALFSAKESLYKAIHRHVRRFVDFDEVEVLSIEARPGHAIAWLCAGALGPEWSEPIEAKITTIERAVHTVVMLRHGLPLPPRPLTP
ncbi:4'-phosphopantetheinyl transferase superfamily protein [Ideonella sp. 4Y16]|nr:4'-phosphopantetheinyl transferase superfamily protein [Ideonella alba]